MSSLSNSSSSIPQLQGVTAREQQILEIACRLFGENGFERTSLRDIAERAGISKAALYYHFPDKDALYSRIVIDSLNVLNDHVRASIDATNTPPERIRAFLLATADYVDKYRYAWLAGSNAFREGRGEGRAAALILRDEFEGILRQCIIDGTRSGHLRTVRPELASKYLLSTIGYLSRWHSPEGALTATQVMTEFVDYALDGLASSDESR